MLPSARGSRGPWHALAATLALLLGTALAGHGAGERAGAPTAPLAEEVDAPFGDRGEPLEAATIALRLDTEVPLPEGAAWPVTAGVPFKEGWLPETGKLALETTEGDPVPAQFEVRGRYPRSGDVRWLGVDFQHEAGSEGYRLRVGGGANPAPDQPVRVERTESGVTVRTGDLEARVARGPGGMLSQVRLAGEPLIDQGVTDGNWLVTTEGERHRARTEAITVERSGPVHATVRVEGRYVDPAGEPSCRWMARLHFAAGQPQVRIAHTFTWIGGPETLKIRELALSFGLAKPAERAAADRSHGAAGEPLLRSVRGGQALALVQDRLFHWGHGESHFGIHHGAPPGWDTVHEGERAGSWVAAAGAAGGATLALRELWETFPKELRAEPERLTAYLWASSGEAMPMDLSWEGLERLWGEPMLEELKRPRYERYRERVRKASDPYWNDPTGLARSHELLLRFHAGGDPGAGAARAEVFDAPPLVLADPAWLHRSEVAGRIWPQDPQRFPELERFIEEVWDDSFEVIEAWGDYGFLYYGDGPHQRYRLRTGSPKALAWRYGVAGEDGVHKAAWLAYMRSGQRKYYRYARAKSRYLNDVHISHANTSFRHDRGTVSAVPLVPWGGRPRSEPSPKRGFHRGFGFFIEHALYYYYLTGDRRGLDVFEEYAEVMRRGVTENPGWVEEFVPRINSSIGRWAFQRLAELGWFYRQLGDPVFLQQGKKLAHALIDLDDPSGLYKELKKEFLPRALFLEGEELAAYVRDPSKHTDHSTYLDHKGNNLLTWMRSAEGEAREEAREAFVRMAQYIVRTQNRRTRLIGVRMAYAYYLTGDSRYLRFGLKRSEQSRYRTLEDVAPRARPEYSTKLSRVSVADTIFNHPYIMAAVVEHGGAGLDGPLTALAKPIHAPPATLVLQKLEGVPLVMELSASRGASITAPDGGPLREEWIETEVTYHPHEGWAGGRLDPEEPLLYRRIVVPSGVGAGELRIDVERKRIAYVLEHDARGAVMVAPEGFSLPDRTGRSPHAGEGPFFFEVPEGAERFVVTTGKPGELRVLGPGGREAELRSLGEAGRYEVTVRPEEAGRKWSVARGEPRGDRSSAVDVSVSGIAPVFAHRDPELLFVPEAVDRVAPSERVDAVAR